MSEPKQPDPQAEVAGDGAPSPQRDAGDDAGAPIDSPIDSPIVSPIVGPIVGPIDSPGQLAAARAARGWSVSDVASKLGMVARQIEAIERGDWTALPGQAFVRGAIRAYGKALVADVEPLVDSVGGAVRAAELRPSASLDAPLPKRGALGFDNGGSGSKLTWILLAVLGVIAIALYFGRGAEWSRVLEGGATGSGAPGRSVETIPVQPLLPAERKGDAATAATAAQPAPAQPPASPAQPSSLATPAVPSGTADAQGADRQAGTSSATAAGAAAVVATAPASGGASGAQPEPAGTGPGGTGPGGTTNADDAGALRFRFEQESWVVVRDAGGKVLLYGLQPADSAREIVGRRPYALVIGNASHVRLVHQGREIDLGAISRQGVARLKID
ncbi:MAG TPA: helix-turn-helix domain-containing protein [Burkholderiaceae bacterium]|nr:helix-turn-helix domain-containing protein [Burkholderiaceae bacterium]